MKTGLLVMIFTALFLCCGCGKSNNRMSRHEMKQRIIQKYSRYIPEEYILNELEGRNYDSAANTSLLLTLEKQNRLEIYDAFLKDVERYQSAK